MESLNTDTLIRLQVDQLEKEKRELNERLRIIAKRVDHTERAFRKEERPLLAKDYEQQLLDDRQTFAAVQKSRIETSRISHRHDLETKKRLSRMQGDYELRKGAIMAKRGNDFRKRKEAAEKKIAEEKAKRMKGVLQQREEEKRRREEEERIRREKEEEEARLEAGMCKLRWPLLVFLLTK
jgi:translation initiation factor 3 subunit A